MDTIKTFVLKFSNDWSMNLAGMIAYRARAGAHWEWRVSPAQPARVG